MRKLLVAVLAISSFLSFAVPVMTAPVYADEVLNDVCSDPTLTPTPAACTDNLNSQTPTNNSIYGQNGVLTKVARLFSFVIGVASVIMIIIGGFRYILSSGDASNIAGAKNTIIYAVIGLLVALAAQSIVLLVLSRL